jgi:tryptophan 2,3-dioxygenase
MSGPRGYHLSMADKPLTYGTYLRVPQLLELQKSLSSPAHHDEALFIIIHQVYELWFKLILHEVDSAAGEIEQDHVYEGTRLLRRVAEIQRLLIHQVRILETMRPQDFLGFRYHLNPASGFQSIQFREVEFLLGLKDPVVFHRLVCEPEETQRLNARLAAPSVSDVFDALLVRRGLGPAGAPTQAVASGPAREEDWRVDALVRIYDDPEKYADLLALCEVLIEIDECLSLWRAHHVQMVERMIGSLRGTGGSAGVSYLQSTLPKRAFPDLWRVRTRLGQDAGTA